jgi:hypothetical protein
LASIYIKGDPTLLTARTPAAATRFYGRIGGGFELQVLRQPLYEYFRPSKDAKQRANFSRV